jgi:ATP-dependent helicase HrpA
MVSSPEQRAASVPELHYPDLPVSARRQEIADAIAGHQVVVLAGETGSGKTTQLPKILLGLGRGVTGMIGHTQPRRIAARAVAERVAEEIGTEVGDLVGYTVRFHDQVADRTLIKVMTDGVLLAELRRDRDLSRYDTIVIDEAHERSLTIDFLLGYLRELLPRRPDLKVVITSATIDPERFARHFHDAPVLVVSGRTYPVEVRYRPLGEDADQADGVVAAVDELPPDGDVLVFLAGEREIRDTAEVLRGAVRGPGVVEVLPLFGRLTAAEQHRVFAGHTGRRIVLATNVAETSLTVPGIRYVIDAGTARISRYSLRTKVQRLPIEPISQASATQRAGRCGRVANGICIRLYSLEDFESRPEFTDPEILRTGLASVLLQMAALDLGEVTAFPFLDPPDPRAVRDGRALLEELGALADGGLTKVGRALSELPVDPRLGRMVIEAASRGCLAEVLVIASALSVQDPRERPLALQQQADELHARFAEPASDLLAWLNLWRYVTEQQEALSSSAFRRLCKRELLSWLRIREWQDLHAQLRRVARRLRLDVDASGGPDAVTTSLVSGLLSQVGLRQDKRDYLGARGTHFVIAPGSSLTKKPPPLVVAAELVETSRLFARGVARVEPEQVEAVAGHLLSRSYAEPHWSKRRGAVMADERVTLYGIPIVARRAVQYSRVDPVASREIFLRHGLVEGDWHTPHAFFARNQQLLADALEVGVRTRSREVGVGDEELYAFYDARIPADVVGTVTFDRWWKKARRADPALLDLTLEAVAVDDAAHPSVWTSDGFTARLEYAFAPGSDDDGVTVDVPLAQLTRLRELTWQVPALRHELVTALIRGLPKALRVPLVPAPDTAHRLLAVLDPALEELYPALSRAARQVADVVIPVDAWDASTLPSHLRPTYRVMDGTREVARGKDLPALQAALAPAVSQAVVAASGFEERTGLTSWDVGDLPAAVSADGAVGYPTLVDDGSSVSLRLRAVGSPTEHAAGVRRLLALALPSPSRSLADGLPVAERLALSRSGPLPALLADCLLAAVDALAATEVRTAAEFAEQLAAVRAGLGSELPRIVRGAATVLATAGELDGLLDRMPTSAARDDLRAQRGSLVHPGFVVEAGAGRLGDVARYLRAAAVRAERAPREPGRDAVLQAEVDAVVARLPGPGVLRWEIEELRVSLFAPSIGARGKVSAPRLLRAIDAIG